jgi:hypothetical protein
MIIIKINLWGYNGVARKEKHSGFRTLVENLLGKWPHGGIEMERELS